MNNYVKYILILFVVSAVAYGSHYLASSALKLDEQWATSGYTLLSLYLLGFGVSLVVAVSLLVINKIMPRNLGWFFLVAVSVKVLVFYGYIYKGLNQSSDKFLEYNFIVVFFVFLIFDVFVAFKALNEDTRTA